MKSGEINLIATDPTIYPPDKVDQLGLGYDLWVRKSEYIKLWKWALKERGGEQSHHHDETPEDNHDMGD